MTGIAENIENPAPDNVRISCALCDATSELFLVSCNGFRIVRCAGCGFVFVNPRPTQASLAQLYSSPEQNPYMSDAYEPFEYERPVLIKVVQDIRKHVQSGRLLEVGCGRGDFLKVAKSQGYAVSGCDLFGDNEPSVKEASFYEGTLRAANLADSSYDLVVMRNTLEHLFNPRSELEEIYRILKPFGYLYVKVPNVRFEYGFACRLVFGRKHTLAPPYHLNYFSARTLRLLLKRTGFSLVTWSIEQPTTTSEWKAKLVRQTGYQIMQTIRFLTAGSFFPKIVLCGVAQKTSRH